MSIIEHFRLLNPPFVSAEFSDNPCRLRLKVLPQAGHCPAFVAHLCRRYFTDKLVPQVSLLWTNPPLTETTGLLSVSQFSSSDGTSRSFVAHSQLVRIPSELPSVLDLSQFGIGLLGECPDPTASLCLNPR